MTQRGISESEVEYCLGHHDISYTDGRGNIVYRATLPTGRRIKVVAKRDPAHSRVVIITVAD